MSILQLNPAVKIKTPEGDGWLHVYERSEGPDGEVRLLIELAADRRLMTLLPDTMAAPVKESTTLPRTTLRTVSEDEMRAMGRQMETMDTPANAPAKTGGKHG